MGICNPRFAKPGLPLISVLVSLFLPLFSSLLFPSGSLQRECTEARERCTNLERQLAAANAAREAAEHALKNEQSLTGRLKEEVAKGEKTCEEYTIEINSLLRDLDDHTASIGTLTEERDRLRTQVSRGRWKRRERKEEEEGEIGGG